MLRPKITPFIVLVLLLPACTLPAATPTAPAPTAANTATLMPILADSATPTAVEPPPTNTPAPTQTPAASVTPLPTVDPFPTVNPWDGALVNWIPAGSFTMGADPGSTDFWGAEYPAHTVTLDAYVMYRNEVTNAMYQACVKAGVCPNPKKFQVTGVVAYFSNPTYDNYPVVYVTYADAMTYCQWAGGRLPTEAQWEKAARGTDARLYPWGNEPLDATRANFCGPGCPNAPNSTAQNDGFSGLAPVGYFPAGASPYGVNDMAGNVLEWVYDWFQSDYYGLSPAENPYGPTGGSQYVIRGGSWFNDQSALRTVARDSMVPDGAEDIIGFRCALPADATQWRSAPATVTPLPAPQNVPATNAKDGANLVLIPAGEFIMGADSGSLDFWGAEAPAHVVALDYYLIYQNEVTNAMYLSCVEAGSCSEPVTTTSRTRPEYFGAAGFAVYPVISVSYEQAASYCQWAGGRLPTEAEWEKAARGEDGRLYPWGNEAPDETRVNYCPVGCPNMPEAEAAREGSPDTKPVGSFPAGASPYGVNDMAGNVLEWVADWFQADYYATSPLANPPGPIQGERRILRGGSWYSAPSALRSAARASETPEQSFWTVGFRCVVDVAKP
ncbi:MAG: formylglycine-generating enzyme family protein [Chloroflexota bacterium]